MWARASDCSEEPLPALSSSSLIPTSAFEHSLILLLVQETQTHPGHHTYTYGNVLLRVLDQGCPVPLTEMVFLAQKTKPKG